MDSSRFKEILLPLGTMLYKVAYRIVGDEDIAKEILIEDEITIRIEMNSGDCYVTAWGCDLTYKYVKINGDYRS